MGFFFFFQAEDGIRDADVTGVQTCALPISRVSTSARMSGTNRRDSGRPRRLGSSQAIALTSMATSGGKDGGSSSPGAFLQPGETIAEEAFAPLTRILELASFSKNAWVGSCSRTPEGLVWRGV